MRIPLIDMPPSWSGIAFRSSSTIPIIEAWGFDTGPIVTGTEASTFTFGSVGTVGSPATIRVSGVFGCRTGAALVAKTASCAALAANAN